jgi:hypothetical protein
MVTNRFYLDGCSMVYGAGLNRDQSLGEHFRRAGYQVTDNSRCGKSNILIATDTYNNLDDHDVFVLGFTYSTRFGLKCNNFDLDFYPGYHGNGLDLPKIENGFEIEYAFHEVYKYFMTVWEPPHCDNVSDFIIDSLVSFLVSQNKTVVAFSWEDRKTKLQVFRPYLGPKYRLPDSHLNAEGMKKLYDLLQVKINETRMSNDGDILA